MFGEPITLPLPNAIDSSDFEGKTDSLDGSVESKLNQTPTGYNNEAGHVALLDSFHEHQSNDT